MLCGLFCHGISSDAVLNGGRELLLRLRKKGARKMQYPDCILLFSGKRKCGKDYLTDLLLERLGTEHTVIIKISAPIKNHWAKTHSLDIDQLMGDGEYKENYRQEMIKWSEDVRSTDPGYFCRAAIQLYNAESKPIWIVSDVRRRTDVCWFREHYGSTVHTIRVTADDDVRIRRGWTYTPNIDDIPSECDLDGEMNWDWIISNNGKSGELEPALEPIMNYVNNTVLNNKSVADSI